MTNILEQLIDGRIKEFKKDFCDDSRALFYDEKNKKLIHPGEFGSYRERITKQLLSYFLPSRYVLSDGFLVNSSGEVSTQCDIIVYDSEETPKIQNEQMQCFYPIETTYAVGEVKSILSYSEFVKALRKLLTAKKMRKNPGVRFPTKPAERRLEEFDSANFEHHNLVSFLVCQKLDFDISKLNGQINEIYHNLNTIPHRHNVILSIEDGLLSYSTRYSELSEDPEDEPPYLPYPFPRRQYIDCKNKLIRATPDLKHIALFLSELSWCLNMTTIYEFNVASYMNALGVIEEIPLKMY